MYKKQMVNAVLGLGIFLVAPFAAQAMVASNFDSDADGWQLADYANGQTLIGILGPAPHSDTLGVPPGSILGDDPSDDIGGRYIAPNKFTSALGVGSILSFDLTLAVGDRTDAETFPLAPGLVLLESELNDLGILYVDFLPADGGAFTSYSVTVAPSAGTGNVLLSDPPIGFPPALPNEAWLAFPLGDPLDFSVATLANFDAVLADPNYRLSITGEITSGTDDVTALDNVVLAAPVPVPAALPLFFSALAGFGFLAKRRKA